jgi:hypothetical protein
MHVLGKVLLGFVVVAAIAAVVLTTMTLDVRMHWESQVATARAEYDELAADLRKQRALARDAQDNLDRVKESWGNVWRGQNSRPTNPATGAVSIGVGTQMGLGDAAAARADNPTVHLFNASPEGSQYLGAFKIQSAQPGSVDAVLNRPPFPGESFPAGTWRVRELIPFDYATRFLDVYTKQIEADARLQRMQFDVTRLEGQLAASQLLLQERVHQLEGDPTIPDANPLQKAGFVQAIRDGLTERDSLMARLHSLRVERLLKLEALQMLTADNARRLARFAEQTGSTAPSPSVSAAR